MLYGYMIENKSLIKLNEVNSHELDDLSDEEYNKFIKNKGNTTTSSSNNQKEEKKTEVEVPANSTAIFPEPEKTEEEEILSGEDHIGQ